MNFVFDLTLIFFANQLWGSNKIFRIVFQSAGESTGALTNSHHSLSQSCCAFGRWGLKRNLCRAVSSWKNEGDDGTPQSSVPQVACCYGNCTFQALATNV
ncbi:Hypothetical protein NTJ_16085 [Nesidiocoris tenuis]|uniref:Secreted protein n=1 Tax=Nesidiocoris tenuis TaxID=355587 RepID=A0ABN7BFX4_9HEMI|nr:Hypothetical protein NTJ_16085 [Nesidiocoris tenuis]